MGKHVTDCMAACDAPYHVIFVRLVSYLHGQQDAILTRRVLIMNNS